MKTKAIFFVPSSILGVLAAMTPSPLHVLILFTAQILILKGMNKLKTNEVILTLIVFTLFFAVTEHTQSANQTILGKGERSFQLDFRSGAFIDGDSFKAFAVDLESGEELLVTYRIRSEAEKEKLLSASFFGVSSILGGELKIPPEARNPGGFDYRSYLRRQQVHWIFDSDTMPLEDARVRKLTFYEMIGRVRETETKHLSERLPKEAARLVSALIFGEQSKIPENLEGAYTKLGISHLLAISGMQVSLLSGLALYAGIRLGVAREKMAVLLILLLPVYAVLAGGSPSVIRSVIMASIMLTIPLGSNRIGFGTVDALALSFLLFLFTSPYILFNPGFQLSYAVTFVLVFSYQAFKEKELTGLTFMITGTVISQLAALPILLTHFYTVPLISILANLVFIPLYSFIFSPVVYSFYILIALFGSVPAWIRGSVNTIIIFSDNLALALSKVPIQLYPGKMPIFLFALYTIGVLTIFKLWEKSQLWKKSFLILSLPFLILAVHSYANTNFSKSGEITMIDVGQGDSILISLPDGEGNYLIDTGGSIVFEKEPWQERVSSFDPGQDIVIPFLLARGIGKLDKLILTHGDQDHIGGALAILEEVQVKEIVMPRVEEKSKSEHDVIALAVEKRIKVTEVTEGDKWYAGGASFHILSPKKDNNKERNDNSISLFTKLGGKSWFFTGDLEEQGEKNIMADYPGLGIDVLKAGHHGSKTSSTEDFLKLYRPKITLISAGAGNRFGHPHTETIHRFKELDTIIFRTDLHGAITYTFYGEKGTFSTHLPYNALSNQE
ncbi:DNA internalization-related competence protein ComEC/Rec2 [Bacillus sp. EB01]|uniref:DNA internalization-related competence protein ComEC/Rec2 n=1 Tax=Bacillus sp. EB01 TaxID=1347086 RepID=UPI0005C588A3|nr:DNA internalization-related competence protein ComEC/Rec2 [Bacillus sp. EB01]